MVSRLHTCISLKVTSKALLSILVYLSKEKNNNSNNKENEFKQEFC